MDFGILYLLTGIGHAARLVVSIHSLRQWYDGPVTVMTTRPESHRIGMLCANDPAFCAHWQMLAEFVPSEPNMPSRNITYLSKIDAITSSPYETTLMLDADTLVAGDISPLIEAGCSAPVTVTEFCGWTTASPHVRRMIEHWREIQNTTDDVFGTEELLDRALCQPMPVINAGVLAVRRGATILAPWRRLAHFGRTRYIPDEIALQLLLPHYDHARMPTRYNCAPGEERDGDEVRIWHFIAGSHLNHEKSRDLWLPVYRECRQRNIAGIGQWSRVETVAIGQAANGGG